MIRPPAIVMVASGLLAGSVGALGLPLSQFGERSVEHLVTVPGVRQGAGDLAASAPRGNSPFAVYSPPANPPAAPAAGSAPPESAPPAPPAPPPKKKR